MTKNTNIRFYEEDYRAWEILHSLDKKQFKSQSKFVVHAIMDYYDRCLKKEQDPYFETREKEDAFANRIVQLVEEKVLSNLPALIGTYVMQTQTIPLQGFTISGVALNGQKKVENQGVEGAVTARGVDENAISNFAKEAEMEENEFLDFGMLE